MPDQSDTSWGTPVAGGPSFSGPTVTGTVVVKRGTTMGHLAPGVRRLQLREIPSDGRLLRTERRPAHCAVQVAGSLRHPDWRQRRRCHVVGRRRAAGGGGLHFVQGGDGGRRRARRNSSARRDTRSSMGSTSRRRRRRPRLPRPRTWRPSWAPSLAAFEIGNEPNFIGSWASVRPKWESFAAAIRAAVPNAPIAGPAAFSAASSPSTSYATSFAQDEASRVVMLTQHYYISGAGSGSTISDMLTPGPRCRLESQSLTAAVVGQPHSRRIPLG